MTTPPRRRRSQAALSDPSALVNIAGLVLGLLAVVTILTAAFTTDTHLGLAAVGFVVLGFARWMTSYDSEQV